MRKEDKLFAVVLVTILIVRVGGWIIGSLVADPDALGLTIFGWRLHHWMYGLVLLLIGIFMKNSMVLGIGTGLFLDELTFILIGGSTHADNYSLVSLVGTLVFVIILFYFRKKLVQSLETRIKVW